MGRGRGKDFPDPAKSSNKTRKGRGKGKLPGIGPRRTEKVRGSPPEVKREHSQRPGGFPGGGWCPWTQKKWGARTRLKPRKWENVCPGGGLWGVWGNEGETGGRTRQDKALDFAERRKQKEESGGVSE